MNPLLLIGIGRKEALDIQFVRKASTAWLHGHLDTKNFRPPPSPDEGRIERIIERTKKLGAFPLYEGYRSIVVKNLPFEKRAKNVSQVRIPKKFCNFFYWLAIQRKPQRIVELGTAFGVSGMYWLSGLERTGDGELITFEPNRTWAEIAGGNLKEISSRFRLVIGTFEEHFEAALPADKKIDLAFIDAIHTGEVVRSQVKLLMGRMGPGGLFILDDIRLNRDMASCWEELAQSGQFAASAAVEGRIGLLELP